MSSSAEQRVPVAPPVAEGLGATSPFAGIHAATLCPFREDFSLDEMALAQHLASVAGTPGIRGLLINGHASENFALSGQEKRRVVEVARASVPDDCLIVSGVNAEFSFEAARHGAEAEAAGADALLIFPPNSWALYLDADIAERHHRHVANATSLPLMLYQAPVSAGAMAYQPPVIQKLLEIDRVVAIKEGSWEVAKYEENLRLVAAIRPDVCVLSSGDEHLLTSYIIGSKGSQVSLAALAPEAVIDLWDAACAADWSRARACHERLYPLARAIYREAPGGRANARLKACLHILGRLGFDAVRPPFPRLTPGEYRTLERALAAAGLLAAR